MSPKALPRKTGVILCAHCQLPTKEGRVQLTRFFTGKKPVELNFCDPDCMKEHLYDNGINEKINKAVEKEVAWLHKQVCPSCRKRIT